MVRYKFSKYVKKKDKSEVSSTAIDL